jgi:hypothetical protein
MATLLASPLAEVDISLVEDDLLRLCTGQRFVVRLGGVANSDRALFFVFRLRRERKEEDQCVTASSMPSHACTRTHIH